MAEKNAVYFCEECKNTVESLMDGGELVCCGKPMKKLIANTVEAAVEKHIPVIERNGNKVTVKIGSVPHPMIEEHHIVWAELIFDKYVLRYDFETTQAPEAVFLVDEKYKNLKARIFCNLHGLWESK